MSLGDDTTSTLAAEDYAYTNGGEVDDDHAVCPGHVMEPHRRGPGPEARHSCARAPCPHLQPAYVQSVSCRCSS